MIDTSILERQSFQTRLIIYGALCGLASLIYALLAKDPFQGIPRIGKSPGAFGLKTVEAKEDFFHNSKRLLDEGYAKFKTANWTMVLIQTSDLPRIVLSPKYLEELRSLPETILSHRESVVDRFLGYWTGLDAVRQSTLHNEICQTTLVQNLPSLVPSMHEEAVTAIGEYMADTSSSSFTSFSAYGSIFNMIARINSRVLVGLPLCRDKEWLQVAQGYPQDSVAVATDLRQHLPLLRPLIYPFLASAKRLKSEYATAHRKLRPLIAERKAARYEEKKPRDVLQWMVDMGTGNDRKNDVIVRKLMFLTMAGFHAPTATAVHVLYDLCAHPEYFTALREEIKEELAAEDGQWTLAVLRRLRKMDSVIKESQRVNAPGLLSFNRKVLRPLTLSDGTRLPAGAILTMPIHHITHDPTIWPDPDHFDGFRFYKKRLADPDKDAEYQFAALGANNLGFGYGRFACPGRVFAAAQLKLVLGLLIGEYEFCFPMEKEGSRPENLYLDDMILPDRGVEVLCKKR